MYVTLQSPASVKTGSDSERPTHPGIQAVIDAACEDAAQSAALPIHPTVLTLRVAERICRAVAALKPNLVARRSRLGS